MTQTAIAAFDSTLQTTNVWLHEIMERMGWVDKHRAYHALRTVLHALRDHLTVEGTAALAAQLPLLIRGIFFEGWHPAGKPLKARKKDDFLAHVALGFADDPADAEEVTRAVLGVLADHVSAGEVAHVEHLLPQEIRSFFLPTHRGGGEADPIRSLLW
ncbi:MAG TPA: DUF2267 domain-containing protein [Gemmataceae bacterium]|nr:DUF2267 domain-containing protein [Gemmataceae bacterium]